MANFSTWYYDNKNKKVDVSMAPSEQMFFDVVGVKIPSLKAFISWLILKKLINPIIKEKNKKPQNLLVLPTERKIEYLVDKLKNLEKLAHEYNNIFGEKSSEGEKK
jgi:hypothetical protein